MLLVLLSACRSRKYMEDIVEIQGTLLKEYNNNNNYSKFRHVDVYAVLTHNFSNNIMMHFEAYCWLTIYIKFHK
ncbi:MAG: hypothetical protein ACXWEW_08430 [Nitrososphaeraceae archaeon]